MQMYREQRKNLVSANVYGRRGDNPVVFVTDSISQPDFGSIGCNQEAASTSGTGAYTKAGTDSVRPVSQPGFN